MSSSKNGLKIQLLLAIAAFGGMPGIQARSLSDYARQAKSKATDIYASAKRGVSSTTAEMNEWWNSLSSEEKMAVIAGAATTTAAGVASVGYALSGGDKAMPTAPQYEQPQYSQPSSPQFSYEPSAPQMPSMPSVSAADPSDQSTIHSASDIKTREDALEFFGLPASASRSEILKRFKKLSLEYHPDKHPKELENWATENVKAVNKARSLLI